MPKYHSLVSIATGLLMLVVLQELATPQPVFRWLLPAFILFAAAVFVYNRWYLGKIGKYNFWIALRFSLFLLATFGVLFFVPGLGLRGLFLILAVFLVASFEYVIGQFAENLMLLETLLAAFGFFFALLGAAQYFPPLAFAAGLANCGAVFLLARAFYEFAPQSAGVKNVTALILALFGSEVFWALTFLPLHFSVLALILFNIFYFCLIVNYYFLFRILSFKKIQFHLVLMILTTVVVVLATRWQVIA